MTWMKNLVITAHPDDETIWMGGTILKDRESDWTILSLCRKTDSERMPKFFKVCKILNAEGIISDLEDEKLLPLRIEIVAKKIEDNLPKIDFDNVYTHGINGEYGHIRHIEIHKAVEKLIEERKISCKKAFVFSYMPGDITSSHDKNLKIPVAYNDSNVVVELDKKTHMKKLDLINKTYGFSSESFEFLSSGIKEAFSVLK